MKLNKSQEKAMSALKLRIFKRSLIIGSSSVLTMFLLSLVVSIINQVFVHSKGFSMFGAIVTCVIVLINYFQASEELLEEAKKEAKRIEDNPGPDSEENNATH